jgi:hypothetical protein
MLHTNFATFSQTFEQAVGSILTKQLWATITQGAFSNIPHQSSSSFPMPRIQLKVRSSICFSSSFAPKEVGLLSISSKKDEESDGDTQ